MQVKIFNLPFSKVCQGFDEAEVREFLRDKEIISVRDHLVEVPGSAVLTLVILYRVPETRIEKAEAASSEQKEASWRETLSEADLPLFNRLREWRSNIARQEGVPPYVICNNRQLAEVVKRRVTALAGLGRISGIGPAKVEKYGEQMLEIVRSAFDQTGQSQGSDAE